MLDFNVTEAGESASLSHAILLYGARSDQGHGTTFATFHNVESINERPEIMPGRLLNERDLVELASSLASPNAKQAVQAQWVDPSVLASGADRLIWWSPPGKRSMFFETSNHSAVQIRGHGLCPVPGLVWMAMPGKGLYVYAVKGAQRPTRETALFQAPFFNVWGRGQVCIGSAQQPMQDSRWSTKAWETMFFGSRFTHPNFAEKNRLTKGCDPGRFWKKMLARPAEVFPEKHLVAMPIVVEDLLDRMFITRINALPKPQGEF